MRWLRRASVAAVVLALAGEYMLIAAPDATAEEVSTAPIEIAVIGPYTGGSADMGISMRHGVELATDEINRAGGLLGRRIHLIERNDEAHNERGARIASKVTRAHPVTAGIGIVNTGVALAAAPYFEQSKIPLIVSVATGAIIVREFAPPEYAHSYVFRFSMSTGIEAPAIVAEAVRRGYRRPAILTDATSYGQVGRLDLTEALKRHDLTPVSIEKFNIGDTDMRAQLKRARSAGADVVLTYGIGPELAAVARDRTALGWNVPLLGSWTLSMASFITGAGSSAAGAMMPETFIDQALTRVQARFVRTFTARFGPHITSPMSAAQGYDSMRVLAAAISQARSTDGSKIRAALEDLNKTIVGVVKTYDHPFDAANHEAIHSADIVFGVIAHGRVLRADSGVRWSERTE
jgi:branched-chain amino acid transport system substrate-binding protein